MPSKQHLHCIYTYLTWPILNLPQALVLLALNSIILISYSFCSIFKHVLVLKQILHVHLFFIVLYCKTNVDSSDYAAVISICYTRGKFVLGNTDQMHEKCIFDVAVGAG